MPRDFMFTREQIVSAALELTREGGVASVTARSLGAKLGASSRPIFSWFECMEEVQAAVLSAADDLYRQYLHKAMAGGEYPPYKASGMAYIRFAQEERELFKLLFMRDRSHEQGHAQGEELAEMIGLIQETMGLSAADAYTFHLEMWLYVHGIATMIATSYLEWDMDFVSRALTDVYIGLRYRYCGGQSHGGENE